MWAVSPALLAQPLARSRSAHGQEGTGQNKRAPAGSPAPPAARWRWGDLLRPPGPRSPPTGVPGAAGPGCEASPTRTPRKGQPLQRLRSPRPPPVQPPVCGTPGRDPRSFRPAPPTLRQGRVVPLVPACAMSAHAPEQATQAPKAARKPTTKGAASGPGSCPRQAATANKSAKQHDRPRACQKVPKADRGTSGAEAGAWKGILHAPGWGGGRLGQPGAASGAL